MNYYESNLECMKEYKIQVYEELMKYNNTSDNTNFLEIQSVETKDEIKALLIKKNNIEFRMNSAFHPIKEAERWVKQYSFYNLNNVIIMFGLGNGLFAEQILINMNESDKLIIYEPSSEVFFHIMNNYNLQKIIKNNNVVIAVSDINEHAFHFYLRVFINMQNVKSRIIAAHPNYDELFPEKSIEFWNEIKDNFFHTVININTISYFGKNFIDNTLRNLKHLNNCIDIFELSNNLDKNTPVILVAAGPSVEDNIEELIKAKGKAIIIAVDRVLEFLLNNDVIPDLVATLDPEKTLEQFSNRDNITIPLLCIFEANPLILERHKGKKIICNANNFTKKIFKDNGKTPPEITTGASVATMIFNMAATLGFKTIILVGQDLSYRGKVTHVGGEEETAQEDMLVEGIDGSKITSRRDWHEFIIWYQDYIKLIPTLNVYDAKASGAKIKGTIVKPLKEIMADYVEQIENISEKIDNIPLEFGTEQIENIRSYLVDCIDELKNISQKAKEGYEACESLLKEWERNRCTSVSSQIHKKNVDKMIKIMQESNIYNLLESLIISESSEELSNVFVFSEDEDNNLINTYNIAKRVFESIEEACKFTKPILVEVTENF